MKPQNQAKWRKWIRRLALGLIMILFLLGMLELFYRNQWIDTYRRELTALNPDLEQASPRQKVLVMGDSFSAAENSWVNVLRKRHPDLQFVNSSVPGTTILQANLMLEGRLETFHPNLLLYEVYVGNDLFDLRYPLNWGEIGFMRNLYWMSANHLRSVGWFNYALGQWKRDVALPDFRQGKVDEGTFDPQRYSERERLYLQAEPGLITNQALLLGERVQDMEDYLGLMQEFLATAQGVQVPVIVLVVPHCAQVHASYAQRMKLVGAEGVDSPELHAIDFPFWQQVKALEGGGVHFVNLLPMLRECEDSGQPMYYLHDAHLNDAGQEVVANVVDAIVGTWY